MQFPGTETLCKKEQLQVSYHRPQIHFNPTILTNHHFYNTQPHLSTRIEVNFSTSQAKKRRYGTLRPKMPPSQEKMKKIDEKTQNYKRSTNNSHKKYISVVRRLLLKQLSERDGNDFEVTYESFKNSRTYYFIVLCHAKHLLSQSKMKEFKQQFFLLMNNKIDIYQKQIENTQNKNFVNFRMGEISDIQYALKSFTLYFDGFIDSAIEIIYKKDKAAILKKHQFERTIQAVRNLEQNLQHKFQQVQEQQKMKMDRYSPFKEEIQHDNFIGYDRNIETPLGFNNMFNNQRMSQLRMNKVEPKQDGVYPLTHLEKSYPIFECFYPIMFPYENKSANTPLPLNLIYSHMQYEYSKKELMKTRSEEDEPVAMKFEAKMMEPFVLPNLKESFPSNEDEIANDRPSQN